MSDSRIVWVSFDTIGRSCLEAAARAGADIAGVVTLAGHVNPNRSGQCSFDDAAAGVGAELIETADINSPETLGRISGLAPNMIFVVGWSQLLRDPLIGLARDGVFGMHPTLLPKHRGRAPIPWTILTGLTRTGVTLFEIVDASADSGPIVGQEEVPIDPDETASTLFQKIHHAHVQLIDRCMPELLAGQAPRLAQDDRRASVWHKRTPADGLIDWDTRAGHLYDWVRALTRPYPGAFTYLGGDKVIVWRARPVQVEGAAPSGTVVACRSDGVVVSCGDGGILLEEIEMDGSRSLVGAAIADRLSEGSRLG